MSNSVDPDETAHYKPSHLDLRYLHKPIVIAYGSKRLINVHKLLHGPPFENIKISVPFYLSADLSFLCLFLQGCQIVGVLNTRSYGRTHIKANLAVQPKGRFVLVTRYITLIKI